MPSIRGDNGISQRILFGLRRTVEGASELLGSSHIDGFEVLETCAANTDGKIDADDDGFDDLAVWGDANGNGLLDQGELKF